MAAAAAGGAAVGGIGSLMQGQSAKALGDMQASIDNQNANEAVQEAAVNEQRQRIRARMQIGADRAGYAASGVDSTQGSAAEVLQSSASNAEYDALLIRYGGQVQSSNFKNRAEMARSQGYNAQMGGYMGAASSLLLGGAKAYSMAGGASIIGGGGSYYQSSMSPGD